MPDIVSIIRIFSVSPLRCHRLQCQGHLRHMHGEYFQCTMAKCHAVHVVNDTLVTRTDYFDFQWAQAQSQSLQGSIYAHAHARSA
jgi:hypothetical protein